MMKTYTWRHELLVLHAARCEYPVVERDEWVHDRMQEMYPGPYTLSYTTSEDKGMEFHIHFQSLEEELMWNMRYS
jgi:hypothetical protein